MIVKGLKRLHFLANHMCSEPTRKLAFKVKACGAMSEDTVLREPRNASDSAQSFPNGVLEIGEMDCME